MTAPPNPLAGSKAYQSEDWIPDDIERDRYGRPLIIQPSSGITLPYSRASSLASYVTNQRGLEVWTRRHIARGIAMSEALAARAATETYSTGFASAGTPEETKANKASGKRLDEIIDEALIVSKSTERRDHGTALHAATEPDRPPAAVHHTIAGDVDAFWSVMRPFQIVATELFVVCDELQVAGTFDHLVRTVGGDLLILDKKTGAPHPEEWQIQLAAYAHGVLYEPDGSRYPFADVFGLEVSTSLGYVAHVPARTATTQLRRIDLQMGWAAARLAIGVREYQGTAQLASAVSDNELAGMLKSEAYHQLHRAKTQAELLGIRETFADVWDPDLDSMGAQRWTTIE